MLRTETHSQLSEPPSQDLGVPGAAKANMRDWEKQTTDRSGFLFAENNQSQRNISHNTVKKISL